MNWLVKAGVITIAGGAAPLLLEIAFGTADSNPVGLGILMVVSLAIGMLLLVLAGIRALFRSVGS